MPRFKNKYHAMQQRKSIWTCKACGEQHVVKPKYCISLTGCNSRDFFYFASHAEATRYAELRLLEKFKKIANLKCQPTFPIKINGIHVRDYRADFSYKQNGGQQVIEDVKGKKAYMTDLSKLKIDIVQALYGIEIKIVEVK